MRPPLRDAMQEYFKLPDEELPVQRGQAVSGGLMTIFPLQHMMEQGLRAGEAALISGWNEIYDQSGECHCPGKADPVDAARFFIHGTGVLEALGILKDRTMRIEDGPAGIGVYGLRIEGDSTESIVEGWKNVAGSGYCKGAAFILDAHGLTVNASDEWRLPPGSAYWSILQGVALASLDSTESIVV